MAEGQDGWKRYLDAVPVEVQVLVDTSVWRTVHQHPEGASCGCPVAAAANVLFEHGFVITPIEKSTSEDGLLGRMAERVQPIAHDFTRNMGYIAPEELAQRVADLIFQVVSLCAAVAKEAQNA